MERVHDFVGVHARKIVPHERDFGLRVDGVRPEERSIRAHALILPEMEHRSACEGDAQDSPRPPLLYLRHHPVEHVIIGVRHHILETRLPEAPVVEQ